MWVIVLGSTSRSRSKVSLSLQASPSITRRFGNRCRRRLTMEGDRSSAMRRSIGTQSRISAAVMEPVPAPISRMRLLGRLPTILATRRASSGELGHAAPIGRGSAMSSRPKTLRARIQEKVMVCFGRTFNRTSPRSPIGLFHFSFAPDGLFGLQPFHVNRMDSFKVERW